MKYLYDITSHKRRLQEKMSNAPFATKFINAVANDVIWLLDESLKGLSTIRELQEEQERGDWNTITPEQRKEKEKALSKQHLSQFCFTASGSL